MSVNHDQYLKFAHEVEDYIIILLDQEGNVQNWNKGAEKIKGYTAEEVLGKHFRLFYSQADQDGHLPERLIEEASRLGNVRNEGWRIRKNLKPFWGSTVITALHNEQNYLTGYLCITRNYTEERKAEERFRLVVESAPNAMVLVNQEGKIMLVNHQTEKLFGYSREELINQSVEMLIPERFKRNHPGYRNSFFEAPKVRSMGVGRDLYALRKDKTEFPVEIGLNPIELSDGPVVLAAIIDITERKKADERFRLVVESAPNAMVLINTEGKIALVNSETERLFGYNRNELISADVEILIPSRFKDHHPEFRKMFFTKPQTRSMGAGRDLFAMRKNGSEFPVEIGLNPIESPEGNMVLASIIDITERKIQETNRLKSDFLANMSHELRTPLNAILGFSELLLDEKVGPLTAKQLEYLHDIHASGGHLLQLINDVLDLSKIESGKVELTIEPFSLIHIVKGVVKVLKPIADKKNVTIHVNLSSEIDTVHLDKNKFKQILFNLVSNAIKFNTPGGRVTIETKPIENNMFALHVIDTGIGILEADLIKIFVPFVQLDSGPARKHEGTGLGLALTKNLVELHGGKISIMSTLGSGSTFSIIIPNNATKHKS